MGLKWLDWDWLVSILAYPAAVLALGLLYKPPWSNAGAWAEIVTLSFGMAAGLGVCVGVIVTMIIAIPGVIGKIRHDGKLEGIYERDKEWIAWYNAKQVAESAGIIFTEPPPAPVGLPTPQILQLRALKCKNHNNIVIRGEPVMSSPYTDGVSVQVARKYECPYCGVRAIEEEHDNWVVVSNGAAENLDFSDRDFPFVEVRQ